MENTKLEIKAALQILKPVNEVYEAIVDPSKNVELFHFKRQWKNGGRPADYVAVP